MWTGGGHKVAMMLSFILEAVTRLSCCYDDAIMRRSCGLDAVMWSGRKVVIRRSCGLNAVTRLRCSQEAVIRRS